MSFELPIVIAVIIGLIQVVKYTELVSPRFFPLIAVVLGVLFYGFLGGGQWFNGIIAGLSSVGLFSGAKAMSGN